MPFSGAFGPLRGRWVKRESSASALQRVAEPRRGAGLPSAPPFDPPSPPGGLPFWAPAASLTAAVPRPSDESSVRPSRSARLSKSPSIPQRFSMSKAGSGGPATRSLPRRVRDASRNIERTLGALFANLRAAAVVAHWLTGSRQAARRAFAGQSTSPLLIMTFRQSFPPPSLFRGNGPQPGHLPKNPGLRPPLTAKPAEGSPNKGNRLTA